MQAIILGITPACAGKSLFCAPLPLTGRDHPRACGEKTPKMTSTANRAGSPPRVRGKAYPPFQPDMVTGITPARAGKSTGNRENAPYGRDHPRACGEKFFIRLLCSIVQGSPPRVRGKVSVRFTWKRDTGITPARAGKRRTTLRPRATTRDHPRACGEKEFGQMKPRLRMGSPPRVRGKAAVQGCIESSDGITPARAGKRL